jgi:predicted secreted acid phosphatase
LRRGVKSIDTALEDTATASTALYRLRAEAKERYGVGTSGYKFVTDLLTKVEASNKSSTQVLEDVQDSVIDSGMNGSRFLNHLKSFFFKIWDRLEKEGVVEPVPTNVRFIEEHRTNRDRLAAAQQNQEPPEAA